MSSKTDQSAASAITAPREFIKVSARNKAMSSRATSHVAFVHVPSQLMFAAKDLGRADFGEAQSKAAACRLLGYDDWFSPDDMQAQIIIDRGRFPVARTDLYTGELGLAWTSRPHPSASSCACYVDLHYGLVLWGLRNNGGLALACRRVSPRQLSALGL